MSEQRPSVGRVVHYVLDDGTCGASVVTDVRDDPPTDVELLVFPPSRRAQAFDLATVRTFTVSYDDRPAGEREPFTWHWPERVDA